MRKCTSLYLVILLAISARSLPGVVRTTDDKKERKHVKVFIEGDTSVVPKFIKVAQEKGPERNLEFEFTRDKEADWDVRVVLSAEGSSMWSYAHGNIVVMDKKSNVLFTVTRSDRWTGKGAANALTKEFVKMLSRYYGLSK